MTKGEYPYPPDEFDAVDPSAGPQGVHRRPRSRWAAVWPFLAALAVAAALALVVVNLVWGERTPTPSAQGTGVVVGADEAPADDTGADDPSSPPVAEPEPTAAPVPSPEPDLEVPVQVLNATSVVGLAARAAEQLEDAGWTQVSTDNYAGTPVPSSRVTYAAPDLEVSARAVADVLGIETTVLARGGAADGVVVVLEQDVTG